MAAKKGATGCELCGGVAAVHCAADSAFLCLSCDAKVHGANFLASRHLRRRLDEDARSGSSASSSCVSTADSAAAPAAVVRGRKRRARAEVVLEGWAKRMGFAPGRPAGGLPRPRARSGRWAGASPPRAFSLRVAMAAALWSEVAAAGGETALLRRLEASAHVPARLVVTVASWMARAARRERAAEEGWAECP